MKRLFTICALTAFVIVLAGTAAAAPDFEGFETGIGTWVFYDGGAQSDRVVSGGGLLGVTSASGAYHAELGNVHDNYQDGYGSAGYSYFGGTDPVYQGSFYGAVDVYIDPTWSGLGFWIDMSPRDVINESLYAAEANFRLTADGTSVTVQAINSSFLTTITTAGWYSFEIVWSKGATPTDLINITLTVYDSAGGSLGTETLSALFPQGTHAGESQYLGNNSYVWFTVWENGFAGDVIAIDNVRTGLVGPIVSNVVADPNPMAVNSNVNLTANVRGLYDISSAEYEVTDSEGYVTSGPMAATNGEFNDPNEDVVVILPAPSEAGIYNLCVSGTDANSNTSPEECILLVVYDPDGGFVTGGGWIDSPPGAYKLDDLDVEMVAFFNGFETDIAGWVTPTRVTSGTDGIPSASGDYHAEATGGDFTRWGGYNSEFPSEGYITSIDIYLDVDGVFVNDTRFDWTSAITRPDGEHRRDFIFNGGFYSDDDGSPGSGFNRFIVSASNNAQRANSYPKNPGRDPIAITTTGWYTLQHRFYDSGGGVLAVDLNILDSIGNIVHTWTLSDVTDIIGNTVGGNRYGWFAANEFLFLAIDNTTRIGISAPTGKANFGFVSKYNKKSSVPTGSTEFVFKAGDLNFHSTSYDWMLVTGSNYAKFKGSGTVNGEGDYRFKLWAGDDDPDTFRIKIWVEDEDSNETVIYDNGDDQEIGGGSIVIHTKKK